MAIAQQETQDLTHSVCERFNASRQIRKLIKEIKAKYLKSQSTKSKEVKTAIAKISKIDKDTLITASF